MLFKFACKKVNTLHLYYFYTYFFYFSCLNGCVGNFAVGCGPETVYPHIHILQCMLERINAITIEVLEPFTFVRAYPTVYIIYIYTHMCLCVCVCVFISYLTDNKRHAHDINSKSQTFYL
jgi:hypothetical protein